MRANPFTYGNPITDPARFFGRSREIEQVFSRLRNVEFESSSLVGERRIGKTSLLYYLAHPAVRGAHGLDPAEYHFIYVDLQMVDRATTPARLWQRLLRQIGRHLDDAEIKAVLEELQHSEPLDNFALADLFDVIDDQGMHLVLLLDEFENVTENENFGPDFFYGLRSLAIHHNLALVTSSRRELIELCHSEAIRSSPFFNIFANINVRLWSDQEARMLLTKSLEGTNVAFTPAEAEALMRLAGPHPYFLQAAASFLFQGHTQNLPTDARLAFLTQQFRDEAIPHLSDFWFNSDDHEKIVLTVLALLEQQTTHKVKTNGRTFQVAQLQGLYARSDQTLAHLDKRGLVVARGDGYALFNAVFGKWILYELTDTLNDPQSYDDWSKGQGSQLDNLSTNVRNQLKDILPKFNSKYRPLLMNLVSDAVNLVTIADILRGAVGI